MAYVKLNEGIRSAVYANLKLARDLEAKNVLGLELPADEVFEGLDMKAVAERIAWGEYLHLRDRMPNDWKCFPDGVDFHIAKQVLTYRFPRDGRPELPPKMTNWRPDLCITSPLQFGMDEYPPNVQRCIDFYTKDEAITNRYETWWKQLSGFFDKCKSLNEAVKLYPDLRLLLSDEVKARLDHKRERSDRSEPDDRLAGLDTASITGAAVASTLLPK